MKWKGNEELGREYMDQATELEREIVRLREKKLHHPESVRKLRRKIDILETMIYDLRKNGVELLHYGEDQGNDP